MTERRQNPPVLERYGQHFLADRAVLADIASAVDPGPSDTVVEIGPGNVLSGLLKRIVPGAGTITLGTADEVEEFVNA